MKLVAAGIAIIVTLASPAVFAEDEHPIQVVAVTILGPNGGELDTIKLLYQNDACAAFYGGDTGKPPSQIVELCPGAEGHVAVMWMWQFGTRTVVGGGLGEFHAGAAFSGGEAGGLRAAVRIAEPPMR